MTTSPTAPPTTAPARRWAGWMRATYWSAVRAVGSVVVRTVPGVMGAVCIIWGVSAIYRPAGWLVTGAFLLMIDRRIP